jgi:hypothetical protein
MATSVGTAGGNLAEGDLPQYLTALVEHGLLDDLVRSQQDRLRDCEAERLGRLHVDHQLELRGLLDGQVG